LRVLLTPLADDRQHEIPPLVGIEKIGKPHRDSVEAWAAIGQAFLGIGQASEHSVERREVALRKVLLGLPADIRNSERSVVLFRLGLRMCRPADAQRK
jgi:hypothetical protein